MAANVMRFKKVSSLGVVAALVALNAPAAYADDSGGGLLSGVFSGITRAFSPILRPSQTSQQPRQAAPVSSATPVAAQTVQPPRVESKPAIPVTQDSSISISGTVPEGAHWLYIASKKAGESAQTRDVVVAQPGAPLPMIYLQRGPGDYKVNLFISKDPDKTKNAYVFLTSAQVRNEDTRDVAYLLPSASIQSDDPKVVELAQEITRGLSTDREKALAIHDWITRELTYDLAGRDQGNEFERPQDARSVLDSKIAICDGFSNIFAALSRAAGLRAKVILGPRGILDPAMSKEQGCKKFEYYHAWNEVYVDNRWVFLDVTTDTGSRDYGTGRFNRTPNNRESFDLSESAVNRTYLKCSEELR